MSPSKYNYTATCVDCGKGCRTPYLPNRPPRCKKCRNKVRMRVISAERLGCPCVYVSTAVRTEEEQTVIDERVILYGWRYDRGLDIYTGEPLSPADFIENGTYVIRTPNIVTASNDAAGGNGVL